MTNYDPKCLVQFQHFHGYWAQHDETQEGLRNPSHESY